MDGMSMSSSATSAMMMATSTTASAMSMATSTDMSSMDMSSSSDSMDMSGMNMYFTTHYDNYPVIFKTLKASNGAAAFGIFCILFFGAFALRGFSFLSLYLEQKIWRTQSVNITIDECECDDPPEDFKEEVYENKEKGSGSFSATNTNSNANNNAHAAGGCCGGGGAAAAAAAAADASEDADNAPAPVTTVHTRNRDIVVTDPKRVKVHTHKHTLPNGKARKPRSVLAQLFAPGLNEVYRDLIRLVIYFVTAMFSFVLMIAAMSYVLLYFFAICLGLAFGEMFFNRLRIATGLNDNINGVCGNLH